VAAGHEREHHGLLRQYFAKSTDLPVHTAADLDRVESELNRRPRMILGDRSPAELFNALLTSQNHPPLQ
jgi:IS30 family transposase